MLCVSAFLIIPGILCSVIPRSAMDLTRGIGQFEVRFHSQSPGEGYESSLSSQRRPYYVLVNHTKMCCYVPIKKRTRQPALEMPNATEVAEMDRAVRQYIGNQCMRTRNSWWFFELCWDKYLGQFHYRDESSNIKETEIYLFQGTDDDVPVTFHDNMNGKAEPYLSYQYGNGSWCHEMKKNRTTEIKAYCNRPGGQAIPHLQYDIVQPKSCHHVVSFYTEALCSFKWFQPNVRKEYIDCFPSQELDKKEGEIP